MYRVTIVTNIFQPIIDQSGGLVIFFCQKRSIGAEIRLSEEDAFENAALAGVLAGLSKDFDRYSNIIKTLEHTVVSTKCTRLNLRIHYPSFRQGKPIVAELVDALAKQLIHFALPRSDIIRLGNEKNSLGPDEFMERTIALHEEAKSLFIKAQKATNRNGEGGELLLYLLCEWILQAPQLLAKMSLKTNRQMPVYGSDGIHFRYVTEQGAMQLLWGESKLHATISGALSSASDSILKALTDDAHEHELRLVQRNIDFTGLDPKTKSKLLSFLDPFDPNYNLREDVITCLVAFNFNGYEACQKQEYKKVDETFRNLVRTALDQISENVADALIAAGAAKHPVEFFLFPVPSVAEFRDAFQSKIGWS